MSSGASLHALGPIALAARSFQRRAERRLTAVVKVTTKIVPDAPLAVIAPRPIVASERYLGAPTSSLAHPGDLALRVPRAQILVVGAVYAAGGTPTTTCAVRLVVARGESMLIDKRLEVVGDRRGPARASGLGGVHLVEQAAPFVRVPLVYERAFGGAGLARNPVGTGAVAGDGGLAALPNVHYAHGRIAEDPAGFGPISSLWPARRELLAATSRQAADLDLDARLSDDFSDAYFVSAPTDQRLDAWHGAEMIALFQMHPDLLALRMHVPRWVASAVLQTERGVRVPIPMRLDTILLEPDAMVAELTYRGDIRVDDEALRGARVGATVADEKVDLPDLSRGRGVAAESFALGEAGAPAPAPPRRQRDATLVLDEPTVAPPGGPGEPAKAIPFEPRRARAGTMVMESSPPPPPPPPPAPAPAPVDVGEPPRRARANAETMILEADGPAASPDFSPPDDPDTAEDAPATQLMAAAEPRRARVATVSLDVRDEDPVSLPFEKPERTAAHVESPKAPLPGAPWSPGDFRRPKPIGAGLDRTLGDEDTDDASPRAVASPPATPRPPPPPPSPSPSPPEPADGAKRPLWREDPAELVAAAPLPKAPRSRASFKAELYKKIKK